jgi:hypothetical protein
MEKYNNGRLVKRSNGRFRKATLRDIGMGYCETCHCVFTPTMPENGDPVAVREAMRLCNDCRVTKIEIDSGEIT